ncbi:MAG: efflux RND transporter periplasmic adaptor subunit [Chitinophagales bacterium]|nr:efflux RND transporter periplasmic adaptor subunit [Chitinophagales bacterium]MDW8427127.1 efflux RND transporter periplasmic adaptor subunit [Chitinophagales bacterium]
MTFKRWLYVLTAVALGLVVLTVMGRQRGWFGAGRATEVTVDSVVRRTIVERVSANGKIYAQTDVKISPDVSGEIVELFVAEGDSVREGQLLVRIKPDIYQAIYDRAVASLNTAKANLLQAQAAYTQAAAELERQQKNYERNKRLLEQGVISEAEWESIVSAYKSAGANAEGARMNVEAAQYNVRSAEAGVKEAHEDLRKTMIFAPMSGIVTKLNVEKGERVLGTAQMEGTTIMHISDLRTMEAWVEISENDVLRVSVGDSAEVEVDAYPGEVFRGVVKSIGMSATEAALGQTEQVTNFQVKILLLNDVNRRIMDSLRLRFPFLPGMTAAATILTRRAEHVLAVPIQAVTTRADTARQAGNNNERNMRNLREVVFVLEAGKARERQVVTGIQDDQYIQIISGLDGTEQVISGPYAAVSRLLSDGDPVKVVSKEKLVPASEKTVTR